MCEILGLQDSEVTTPDSDIGEEENVGLTSCSTSAFQSNSSLPVFAASGARDDNPTQIAMSPNVSRLTPAWSFFLFNFGRDTLLQLSFKYLKGGNLKSWYWSCFKIYGKKVYWCSCIKALQRFTLIIFVVTSTK